MVPLQMYRLNITGFIIYKGILSQNIISSPPFIRFPSLFNIERKHLFNRPENFPMGTGFYIFCFSLSLKGSIQIFLIISFPPALLVSTEGLCCDLWLALDTETWLLPSRSSESGQGIPWCTAQAQAQCSSSHITPPQTRSSPTTGAAPVHSAVRCMATGTGFGSA